MNARLDLQTLNGNVNGSMHWKAFENVRTTEERLPFTVKIVRSEEELRKAVYIRHAAYGRHLPALAELLKAPEPYDREQGTIVLLAESKLDGSPIGTMRIQTNLYGELGIEESVKLPEWLQHRSLAEVTRLGVSDGRIGRVVKTALFKALYFYCLEEEIDWMVVTARKPLDRGYEALLFQDVYPGGELIPMHHVGNIPHRVMAFEVGQAYARWTEVDHPLLDFMCGTRHPDIDLSSENMTSFSASVRPTGLFNTIGVRS
jgi:hypothetical protein